MPAKRIVGPPARVAGDNGKLFQRVARGLAERGPGAAVFVGIEGHAMREWEECGDCTGNCSSWPGRVSSGLVVPVIRWGRQCR